MVNTIHYSNPNFNRASELRLTKQLINDNDLVLLVDEDLFVFECHSDTLKIKWLTLHELNLEKKNLLFLGINSSGKNLWATRFKYIEKNKDLGTNIFVRRNIRDVFKHFSEEEKALLTYASGLMKWSDKTVFCGVCGSETIIQEYGHNKVCQNEKCKTIFYPQISPAIIVLIEYHSENDEPQCLLQTRQYQGKAICSTFAGFVEIGESLEDAVKREMKEEVNVDIKSMNYICSQPWIFTSSLMIGYYAKVDSKDFSVDGNEIKQAQWFTAKELKNELVEQKTQLSLPDSISRYLMEQWINENQ